MAQQSDNLPNQSRRTRPYEIRYATEYFSNALWDTFRDYDSARSEVVRMKNMIAASPYAGAAQIIKSVEIV